MSKQKTLPELEAERAACERQLVQLQHKVQQYENRIAYCEKGERRKRTHRLITRGAAVESVAPTVKAMTEVEFYALAESVFALPEVQRLLTEAILDQGKHRAVSFSCHPNQAQRRTVCRCRSRLPFRRKAPQRILRRGQRLHPQGRCGLFGNPSARPRPAGVR